MDISTKNSGYESLFDRCSSLCSELVKQGCKFSFSLKLEESFSFTLSSEKAVPRGTRKRPPSYQRRQLRRKTELLQRRTEFRRTNEAAEDIDNDGRRQEGADLLDKKMVSSRQTATEDNNTPLNLNPRAIYPRGSAESVDTEDDFDEIQQWAAGGTVTEKSVSVSHSVRQFGSKTEEEGQEAGSVDQDAGSVDQGRPPETPRRSSEDPERDQWTSVTHKRQSPKTANVPTTTVRRIPASHSTWAKPALTDVRHSIWNHQSGYGTERIVFAPAEVSFDDIMKAMKTPIDWRYVRPTSHRYDKWVYFPMENAENAKERESHVNSAPFV